MISKDIRNIEIFRQLEHFRTKTGSSLALYQLVPEAIDHLVEKTFLDTALLKAVQRSLMQGYVKPPPRPVKTSALVFHGLNAYERAPKRATIRAGRVWTLGRTYRCACFDRSAIKRATRFLNLGGIDEYRGRPERSLVVRTVSTIVRGLNTERVVLYTIIKNLSYDDSLKER